MKTIISKEDFDPGCGIWTNFVFEKIALEKFEK